MTSSKNTKRALLASVLSVVLCCAMLIGSTFAWFTDSVSTSVNRIQAGTLKIALVDAEGNSLEGETLGWKAFDNRAQNEIFWEPGATYNTEEFFIKNDGNLNLKFKFLVSGIDGDAKLLEVIDFTAMAEADDFTFAMPSALFKPGAGETFDLLKGYEKDLGITGWPGIEDGILRCDEYILEPGDVAGPIAISGHMQEEAGNDYQGLSIEGIAITLIAAQATGDEDSFNGVYDEDAEYLMVDSVDDLQTQLGAAQSGDTVVLSSAFDGTLTLPEEMAEGVTIASMGAQVDKIEISNAVNDVTFDGFVFNEVTANAIELANGVDIGTVTFKDCAITGTGVKGGRGFSGGNQNTELVFEDCTFSDIGYPIYDAFNGYKSLTIRGCTFSNSAPEGAKSWAIMIQHAVDTVVIDGCTFDGCTDGILKMTGGCTTSFTFTNNTMTNCDEHDPYGLFQLSFGGDCSKTISGNTLDGSDFNTLTN